MAQWIIVRSGEEHGPLSGQQLKNLASTGQLRPDDQVRRGDAATLHRAGDVKGLFPPPTSGVPDNSAGAPVPQCQQNNPSDPALAPSPVPRQVASPLVTAAEGSLDESQYPTGHRQSLDGFRRRAHEWSDTATATARFVALQTERAKLQKHSLPKVHAILGKHIFSSEKASLPELSRLSEQIRDVRSQIEAIGQAASASPAPQTVRERAKSAAQTAKRAAHRQMLELKENRLFAELGRTAFDLLGEKAGPDGTVQAIVEVRDRLIELEAIRTVQDVKRLSSSDPAVHSAQPHRPLWERTALIVALSLFCFPVGLYLAWRNPWWGQTQKWLWTGAVGGIFMLGAVSSALERREVEKDLTQAQRVWEAGDTAAAVAKYRPILDRHYSILQEDEKPLVYGRLIDFDAMRGDDDSARSLLTEAEGRGVIPSIISTEANKLATALAAERAAEEQQRKALADRPHEPVQAVEADTGIGGAFSASPSPQLRSSEEDGTISAALLYAAFDGNEVAANEKYEGQTITVEGEVVNVSTSGFAGTSVNLARRRGLVGVRCYLTGPAANSDQLKQVRPGAWVEIRGECEGMAFSGVRLSDCEFVIVNH